MRFHNPSVIPRNLAKLKRHIRFLKAPTKIFNLMNKHAITEYHMIAFTFSRHFLVPFFVSFVFFVAYRFTLGMS